MVRKRSWPAVSHICSFTRLPSSSMVRILKSMPIVVMKDGVKESSLKRSKQHDLPTPESPIKRSLIWGEGLARTSEGNGGGAAGCSAGRAYQEVVVSCARHIDECGGRRCGLRLSRVQAADGDARGRRERRRRLRDLRR
jgi:hypothetical protein